MTRWLWWLLAYASLGIGIVGMLFAALFALIAAVVAVLLDRRGTR